MSTLPKKLYRTGEALFAVTELTAGKYGEVTTGSRFFTIHEGRGICITLWGADREEERALLSSVWFENTSEHTPITTVADGWVTAILILLVLAMIYYAISGYFLKEDY